MSKKKGKKKCLAQNFAKPDDIVRLEDEHCNLLYRTTRESINYMILKGSQIKSVGAKTYRMTPPVKPSKSRCSFTELTRHDMTALAAINWADQKTPRHEIERLIGYGVLPVPPELLAAECSV